MSSYNTKQGEALYIIILRDPRANEILKTWATWTRKSFGMLANYILLTTIDSIGLLRLLIQ